ncbi:hypothetical protein ACFXK0_26225 [Nocardia sp. NPDC059177]|uniref:hypothetical protein n=1 Tax=Nocardia sp. NPDC059177 TaxID=3346759 RepID=UPI00367C7489
MGGENQRHVDPRIRALTPEQVGIDFREKYCRPDVDTDTVIAQLRVWNTYLDQRAGQPVPADPEQQWLIGTALHITRWLQQELSDRTEWLRARERAAQQVGQRLATMLRTLGAAISFMVDNADALATLAETLVAEGFDMTPTGMIALPDHPRDADPETVERRRIELLSTLVHLVRERDTVQAEAIAQMRAELGAGDTGIPSIISESQRFGIDLIAPFRQLTTNMPPSPLLTAMEQFISDAELAQHLIDDPDSEIDLYRAFT